MTSLHQQINEGNVHERESAARRLQSRWIPSSRVVFDRPPSQPLSPRHMSRRTRSGSVQEIQHKEPMFRRPRSHSVDESQHNGPGTGDSQRGSADGEFQCSKSKWTSGSGAISDTPPSKPISHRGAAVESLELSGSRLNAGSQADFGTASSQALGCHQMIFERSAAVEQNDTFDSPFWNLSR
jgi:hypothetical protein